MNIIDRSIDRIFIIDDDPNGRQGLELTVEETDMQPVAQDAGITDLIDYLNQNFTKTDGLVSDHHLKKKNYFPVNGAEVVYESYKLGIPSVLVTRYEQAVVNEIRKYRENIPIVLNPKEFNPDTLVKSLEICVDEFNGKILSERKAWRTLIKIDDVDDANIFVFIPSWDRQTSISYFKKDLPDHIREIVKPDMKLHVEINIGANDGFDLYFKNWEVR